MLDGTFECVRLKLDSPSVNFDGLVHTKLCSALNRVLQVDSEIRSLELVGL